MGVFGDTLLGGDSGTLGFAEATAVAENGLCIVQLNEEICRRDLMGGGEKLSKMTTITA